MTCFRGRMFHRRVLSVATYSLSMAMPDRHGVVLREPTNAQQSQAKVLVVQATLALYGGHLLPYYLHEETGWSLSVDDLKSQTYKVQLCGSPLAMSVSLQ